VGFQGQVPVITGRAHFLPGGKVIIMSIPGTVDRKAYLNQIAAFVFGLRGTGGKTKPRQNRKKKGKNHHGAHREHRGRKDNFFFSSFPPCSL
jgi:hypothetical protein